MNEPFLLETPRLYLREFTLDDVEVFLRLGSDPVITRFTGDGGFKSVDEARASLAARPIDDYRKHGYGRWACVLKASGAVIGFSGLKYLADLGEVDVGYRFLPEFWGKGLATESATPVIEYGFKTLKLERILGLVMPENVASVRVLEKLGLSFVEMIDYCDDRVAKYAITKPL